VRGNDRLNRQMWIKRLLIVVALGTVGLALGAGPAMADTTHPFLGNIEGSFGSDPQPMGVDGEGNLILWLDDQDAVAKFDTNGNPVNFTGLGTNILDGKGSFDCPNTPSDCDQVPGNGFGAFGSYGNGVPSRVVAVDGSGGPADGYIYVQNNYADPYAGGEGEIDVFDSSGVFKGKINQGQVFPDPYGMDEPTYGVSVGGDGAVYVDHYLSIYGHVDRFVPVDGVPAHDQFSGQIRQPCAPGICLYSMAEYQTIAAGEKYVYVGGRDQSHIPGSFIFYMRFPQSEFHKPGLLNAAVSEVFPPDPGPFKDGGYFPPFNSNLEIAAVDPADEHVYIGGAGAGIEEYDPQNNQVGPMFANEGSLGDMRSIAIDRTGGAGDGRIYVRGRFANRIAIFGPPVTIPDVTDVSTTVSHTTADVNAEIGLAGGPAVSDCHFDYGVTVAYNHTLPCAPAAPYGGDTQVFVNLSGLKVESDYHFRFVVSNANGTNASNDQIFHTHAVVGVRTDPASEVESTSAKLNGSVDPDGFGTEYRFEYGLGSTYGIRTDWIDAGEGSGDQPTAVSVASLQPGRVYHYRIVARNELGKTAGGDRTFVAPDKPSILGVDTTNLTDNSAELHAQINPFGYDTKYRFEYGTTPAYGSSTPEVDLGAGGEPEPVSAQLEGLQAGIEYHFRIVASNQWGTSLSPDSTFSFHPSTCPNSHIRQLTTANLLPDCRAYELVSPGSAGSVTLLPGGVTDPAGDNSLVAHMELVGPNGNGTASSPPRFGFFATFGSVSGLHPPNSIMDMYVATRTTSGWVTTRPGLKGDESRDAAHPRCDASMSKCLDIQFPYSGGHRQSLAPQLWDVSGQNIGRLPTNFDVVPNSEKFSRVLDTGEPFPGDFNTSADFSHFVFSSNNVAFAPGGLEVAPGSAYDNELASGKVTIVSVLPGGGPIQQVEGASPNEVIKIPAVSADGSHILMSVGAGAGLHHLFMRVGDAVTYDVGQGELVDMTENGSKVAFTSPLRLVPQDTDSSVDLYLWEEAGNSLKLLSQGNGNGDVDSCNASFVSGCDVRALGTQRPDLDEAMAADAGDVYFYSPEQLDPERPGVRNERNLYVYRDGKVQYVTTLDPGTQVDRIQVSPDGGHMAFLSRTQATGYVNASLDSGTSADSQAQEAWEEMYTFDPSNGDAVCASCIPSGQPPTIPSVDTDFNAATSNKDVKASKSGPFMSSDGRVAFATADALAPRDTNGKIDIYEFVGNRAQLITTGTGERDTLPGPGVLGVFPTVHTGLESFSRDGTDLYFSTYETLVPEDRNGSFTKFYDARTAGGFPIPTTLLPCTAADECHGDSSTSAAHPHFETEAGLGGGGNVAQPERRRSRKQRRGHRRTKHRRHTKSVHNGVNRNGGRNG
jgi:hypothetical protein